MIRMYKGNSRKGFLPCFTGIKQGKQRYNAIFTRAGSVSQRMRPPNLKPKFSVGSSHFQIRKP